MEDVSDTFWIQVAKGLHKVKNMERICGWSTGFIGKGVSE